MSYCSYYQATIKRKECWFFVAILHSYDHLCFDRTLDIDQSIFEFFVPASNEQNFLAVMQEFEAIGIVSNFKKLPNRLAIPDSDVWDKINKENESSVTR
ncbi:MAG TPA: hypothetical protein VGT41_02270 [Candidatus Babeliales bacterium]|nr:hypothetical protein [Candidatus Babeliales bacterium]